MAGGAVETEQVAALSEVLEVLQRSGGQRRAATDRLHVGGEGLRLLLVELGRLADLVRALTRSRHAAGGGLEVRSRPTDALERRAAVLDALQVRSVAGDAADLVELLALS